MARRSWLHPWLYPAAPAWRLAHQGPLVGAAVLICGLGPTVGGPVGTVASGLFAAWIGGGVVLELRARVHARHLGYRARFWVAACPAWWERRTRAWRPAPWPAGPVWELHANDAGRWRDRTPTAAARAFRQVYTAEMARLIRERPPTVSLACSTFNRLSPAEAALIREAGGWIGPGPVHPALPSRVRPAVYRRLQRRLFGGVVSTRPRHVPAAWTTWIIPPRGG